MRVRWLAMLPFAALLQAQAPPGPAGVSGTVTNSVTGEPILRAHVTVRCSGENQVPEMQTFGALTNAKGEFSIASGQNGRCWVQAERVGFATHNRNLALSAGAHSDLKLKLTPTGAITGRVSNAAGEPMQRLQVIVEGSANGGNAMTDDKGEFRIGGLPPGRYRVKATAQNMALPPEIRSDGSVELRDAATYFPGVIGAKQAQRVEVKPGAEVTGIDIKLVQTPVVRVSGKVTGIPPGMKDVMINAEPGQGSNVKPDGTFTIWRLDPGNYTLWAQHWGPTQLYSAPLEIEVTTANLDHLELRMIPPFDLAGQLRFDDEKAREAPTMPKNISPQSRKVSLNPIRQQNVGPREGTIGADDSFTMSKLGPVRYRLYVRGVSGFVKSIRAGQTETDGDILDLRNGAPGPVTVTLSSNYCEISGTVSDSNGPVADLQVVLMSADDPSRLMMGRSDSTGAYKMRTPPGKYTLAAVDGEISNWGPAGPDLDGYQTETVDLSFGDKVTKDLVRPKQ